jgi:hypothetical protein
MPTDEHDGTPRPGIPSSLAPKSDLDLAKELHARLAELLGETVDLLNNPRWRHLQASFNLSRDASGRWCVTVLQVAGIQT